MKPIKDHEKAKQQAKDMRQKLMLFDRLPDHCVACEEPFDRTNKEQVKTWTVVVRKEQESVNLYCPECIERAKAIIKNYEEKMLAKEEAEKKAEQAE